MLLAINENKQLCVYIKDFDRVMSHKTKNKNKIYFCKSYLQCFSSTKILIEHKKVCLSINGTQSARFEKRATQFKTYFKQIPVPLKFYADFESNLESAETYEGSYSENYQNHILCSFSHKLVCVDDKFSKPIVVFRSEMPLLNLLKQFLRSMATVKK